MLEKKNSVGSLDDSGHKIRQFLAKRLNDNQRFIVLCIVIGLLCGIGAVGLHLSIHFIFDTLWHWASVLPTWQFCLVMITAPTFAGLLVGYFGNRYAPNAIGSGIPQTKEAYYNKGGKIKASDGIWRFLLTSLYCGFGNSLGREGPTIHLSSAIASKVGHLMFKKPERIQSATPIGMAAGIAAAFNSPLSAITFVFEELLDNFSMKSLGGIVIAVVTAAAVSRTLLGNDPILSSELDLNYETASWMFVAIPLGFIVGWVGHLFVKSILSLRSFFKSRSAKFRIFNPAIGGLSCGILGLAAYFATDWLGNAQHSVFSIGYESLELAFEAKLAASIVALLLVLKIIAVVLNYATGGSGGLFSPTLFIGGLVGSLVGFGLVFLNTYIPIPDFPGDSKVIGGCVLLGMGSMFSSVIRCPFTSLIIIFEMTGNYSLILPLMACNMISWQLSRKREPIAIYDSLLLQDKVTLRKFTAYQGVQDYRSLPLSTIMTHSAISLDGFATIEESNAKINENHYHFHGYPVIDKKGKLLGLATHHEIEEADPNMELHCLIDTQKTITATPETSIQEAANMMIEKDIQQLPIVRADDNSQLLGLITLNDIARQQNMT